MKCVRLYTLVYLALTSVISYRLAFRHNGAHSRSRQYSHCRSELVRHNIGIHISSMWFTDTTARISEERVNSVNCYVKGVCDGKTGDVTRVLLSDAAYSFIHGHKKLPLPTFRSFPKETVKRIKNYNLQGNIHVGVRNSKNLKSV